MKTYNSKTLAIFNNYKYCQILIGDEVMIHDGDQGHWCKIIKKSNDKRELFIGEFWTYGINGSSFQKGDQIVFGVNHIRITKNDLLQKNNDVKKTKGKKAFFG